MFGKLREEVSEMKPLFFGAGHPKKLSVAVLILWCQRGKLIAQQNRNVNMERYIREV